MKLKISYSQRLFKLRRIISEFVHLMSDNQSNIIHKFLIKSKFSVIRSTYFEKIEKLEWDSLK